MAGIDCLLPLYSIGLLCWFDITLSSIVITPMSVATFLVYVVDGLRTTLCDRLDYLQMCKIDRSQTVPERDGWLS